MPTRFILPLALLFCACSQHGPALSTIRIDPAPPHVGLATIYVRLPEAAGPVSIEGDMTGAGMTPVFGTAARDGAGGQYKGQLELNMPGDWIIQVKAQSADGRPIVQQLNVTVSEK